MLQVAYVCLNVIYFRGFFIDKFTNNEPMTIVFKLPEERMETVSYSCRMLLLSTLVKLRVASRYTQKYNNTARRLRTSVQRNADLVTGSPRRLCGLKNSARL
jgi:hypothetical protein